MRFGVQTIPHRTLWPPLPEAWARIEALGFDSLWLSDHFTATGGEEPWGACFEAWTAGAALAVLTKRIRIGHLVVSNSFRHPALLASSAATVDHISGGRFTLGLGTGWLALEHEAFGFRLGSPGERIRRLAETLEIVTRLWTEEEVSFAGHYYTLKNAQLRPRPLQAPHPPILLGGGGERGTLPLAARYAQSWNYNGSAAALARKIGILNDYCRAIDRDPASIEKSARVLQLLLTEDRAAAEARIAWHARRQRRDPAVVRAEILAGDGAEVRDQVAAYAEAGVQHLMIPAEYPFDFAMLERFAAEVMEPLRGL